MEENAGFIRKKALTQIGIRYAVFAAAVIAAQLLLAAGMRGLIPELTENHRTLFSFLLVILSVDAIGFPLTYLLTKKLPAVQPEQSRLGPGKFLLGIFFCAGICGAGVLVGSLLHFGVSTLLGNGSASNETLTDLMLNSQPFMRILTVGILAPVFEELIFRKLLIDHLVKYGKWVAVAASGIMFGLFHGNFSQCFFAAGLGFFFAYIYIKTGRIRYSIAYHMVINLTTSVVTVAILSKYMAVLESVGMESLMAGSPDATVKLLPVTLLLLGWMAVLAICALVGLILLCVNLKKFHLPEEDGALTFGQSLKAVVTNPGMWVFFAVCLYLFARNYLM